MDTSAETIASSSPIGETSADAISESGANEARGASSNPASSTLGQNSRAQGEGIEIKRKSGTSVSVAPRDAAQITLPALLQAGVHFGHQTSRWNPKMAPYIYTVRNGIHIIHLPKTVQCWEKARELIVEVVSRGGNVLFVGTKKQAQIPVIEEATRAGAFYVARRWLGGMMTNFKTIRLSIDRMKKLDITIAEEEAIIAAGKTSKFTKKERLMMSREREKLEFSLGGIKDMVRPPDLLFVIDIKREDISIKEAHRLKIPVVALVDTNCDPTLVDCAIPSNDDGSRAVTIFCQAVADAIMEGKKKQRERSVSLKEGRDDSDKGGRTDRSKSRRQPKAQKAAAPSASSAKPAKTEPEAAAADEPAVVQETASEAT